MAYDEASFLDGLSAGLSATLAGSGGDGFSVTVQPGTKLKFALTGTDLRLYLVIPGIDFLWQTSFSDYVPDVPEETFWPEGYIREVEVPEALYDGQKFRAVFAGHMQHIHFGPYQNPGVLRIESPLPATLAYSNLTWGFACTGITEIPAFLFARHPLRRVDHLFRECANLKSIPETLFRKSMNISGFEFCFYNCASLTGKAPALWDMFPDAVGTGCFHGCTGLSNYDSIPSDWK